MPSKAASIHLKLATCIRNTVSLHTTIYDCLPTHSSYQGPIVRISPHELHINDPGFIEELYPGPGKPRDKYAYATGQFG